MGGAQLEDIPRLSCLHQEMKKLAVLAGDAPKLVALSVHIVQQPPKLSRISIDRRRTVFHCVSNGWWDICSHRKETQSPCCGLEKLSTCELLTGFHTLSSSSINGPESSEMMLPKSLFGLSFLGQLKIDDFNEVHPTHAFRLARPVFDIEGLFYLLEGSCFLHQGLNSDLLFFDALNQVLDVFLRIQVAVAVGEDDAADGI